MILDNFPTDRIFTSDAPSRSEAYRNLIDELQPATLHDGDRLGAWSVLHPDAADKFTRADDNALVLCRDYNGRSILLMPALARDGQDALMRRHPHLRADIVVAGLPMRDEPLCDPLLDTLQPRLIIIADSEFPATRRASAKLRQRLARRTAPVVYCHNNGALTLDLAPQSYTLRTANGEPPQMSGE